MIRKPTWMNQEDYSEVVKSHMPVCKCCGSLDDLTIDHIIPRWQGGKDELGNYQILCRSCNSSKGPREDHYWKRDFYFDQRLQREKMRTFQRVYVFDKILDYASWFTRPWSEIARRLYLIAGGPGCGKTLGMPVVGHALNFIMRRDAWSAIRRVDKILVLTKEQGLRNQIADDLLHDLNAYNILPYAPRVRCVESYDLLLNPDIVDTADIWVSCIQMLFEKKGNAQKDIERTLALFPLICIDEPHWATEQVLKVVDAASTSLCFGFTGTPINAQGQAMQRFVLLSLYSYQDAVEYDKSLKYLDDDAKYLPEIIEEVGIEEADVLAQGETRTTTSVDPQHVRNFAPARTVAERVAQYISDCDQNDFSHRARHRDEQAIPDLHYPMHGIVYVDRVAIAQPLAQFLNRKFESDRKLFPLAKGWRAEVIHSEYETLEGTKIRGDRMTPNHPWLRSYKNKGTLDARCARLLIVVGMGREGLNNPYCGVYGLSAKVDSAIVVVQAPWGRTIRAVIAWEPSTTGPVLHVAAERLDVPRIITHVAAQNDRILHEGLQFILNMEEHLDGLPTMDALIHDEVALPHAIIAPDIPFTHQERLQVASAIGEAKLAGVPIDREVILQPWSDAPAIKREHIEDWIDLVTLDPREATRQMRHHDVLEPAYIVTRELPTTTPTDEMLTRFIAREHPNLQPHLTDFALHRPFIVALYQQHAQQFHLGMVTTDTTLSKIRNQFAKQLQRLITKEFIGEATQLYQAVGRAMRQKLDVPRGQQLKNGSQWDCAACHIMLTRDEVRREILGFGVQWMMKQGLCPSLAAAFDVEIAIEHLGEDDDDLEITT